MTAALVIACSALFVTACVLGLVNTDRRLLRESLARYRADYLAAIEANRELRAEQLDDIKRRTARIRGIAAELHTFNSHNREN